jgi:hypothetical protein
VLNEQRNGMKYYESEEPFRQAIEAIVGKQCPLDLGAAKSSYELSNEINIKLQDWCSLNARPMWATGGGIVEAADLLVERAIENANL